MVDGELRFGAMIPQGWLGDLPVNLSPQLQYEVVVSITKRLEELRYDSAWLFDHFHPYGVLDPEVHSVFECWTTLTALAAVTSRLRLGQLVTCNSFRQPSLLSKVSATVDVISNGRLELGIGAGWFEEEYDAYGYPFPKPSTRIGQLDEAVQIIKMMWTQERTSFNGKYFTVRNALNKPKPIQKPYPPITIGGAGEKLTMKVAAEHANYWNVVGRSPEEYAKKIEVLKRHCESLGRKYDTIGKSYKPYSGFIGRDEDEVIEIANHLKRTDETVSQFLARENDRCLIGTPEQIAEKLEKYVKLGADYIIADFHMVFRWRLDLAQYDLFAKKVIPTLRSG